MADGGGDWRGRGVGGGGVREGVLEWIGMVSELNNGFLVSFSRRGGGGSLEIRHQLDRRLWRTELCEEAVVEPWGMK